MPGADEATPVIRRLRLAVVGCGIGARHAQAVRALPERYELVAVCDRDTNRAGRLGQELGRVATSSDFAALLRHGDLDLVSVCTPSAMHFEHVLAALEAGVDVVCEKPVAGSLREIDFLAATARAFGRRVFPVFQNRFGHGVRKLRHLVDAGVAGRRYLTVVETAWRRSAAYYATTWRRTWSGALGGALLNQAIHAHDLLFYVGGPARRVSAFTTTLVNPVETDDCAAAALEMADGSLASLAITLGSAAELSRLRFCYERLVAESNTLPYAAASEPWRFQGIDAAADAAIAAALATFAPEPEGFAGQYVDIHRACTTGQAGAVTLDDARRSVELATALYASAESGVPVQLPLNPDDLLYARPLSAGRAGPGAS